MAFSIEVKSSPSGYIAKASSIGTDVQFETHVFATDGQARAAAEAWITWFEAFPQGRADCVYYILSVPEVWPGPPPGAHAYSGLFVKIGRTNDVLRRLKDLHTGTTGQLIIHALEPGNSQIETQRHREFSADRRHGEWFACSPALTKHMFDIWAHYRVLPREHQHHVLRLGERIRTLRGVRSVFAGPPDMINPSLNEQWRGKVLIDTTIMTDVERRGGSR